MVVACGQHVGKKRECPRPTSTVSLLRHEIGFGDDAEQPAVVIDDWQAADFGADEPFDRLFERSLRCTAITSVVMILTTFTGYLPRSSGKM